MEKADARALTIARDALDAKPDQRDSFVSLRCGADTALHERVAALLDGIARAECRDSADGDTSVHRYDGATIASDAMLGARLGPFAIAERVGRGGMGVVYRGERVDGDFAQTVAIKLIRRGYDFDDVHARFLRERRILARLSHPNLARFIDGGVAADGRPWFALEFVRGETITRWCDRHRLDIRGRIKLFLDVCAAVQYAHTQLVVHRDLKPANVLVDDSGAVRLLDFGIAKLVGGDDDSGLPSTIVGARTVLTPEYAAPEQFAGGVVGIAADIYSLGVIAHELIAGALPHAIDRHDLVSADRIVRETPAQPLVLTIARDGGQARRLAARNTTMRAYRADVRGDLARIVDKSVSKEPTRRYATVQAFADDLARWLDGVPVRASGDRLGYRFGKFVKRNRLAVGLSALLVTCIVGGAIGMAWQLHQTRRETEAALQMKDHVVELIEQLDSQQDGGTPPTLLHFVEESVAQLDRLEPGSPLRRELAADLASMLRRVSQPKQALLVVERELGADPGRGARTATTRVRQTAAWAEALLYWDRPDETWSYLARTTAHPGDAAPLVLADALTVQAEVENATKRYALAVQSATKSLTILRQNLADSDMRIANARIALAAAMVGVRDATGGRAQSERVLTDLPKVDSYTRTFALTKAAMRRALFGDFDSAEAAYAEGEAMAQRLTYYAPRRFDVAMRAVNAFDLGQLDRARAWIEPIRQANATPRAQDTWEPWSTDWLCGEIALAQQRHGDAAALFGEAAAAAQRQGASFADFTLYTASLQGVALALDGQIEAAHSALAKADARIMASASYATAMRTAAHGVLLDRSDQADAAVLAFDAALAELAEARRAPIGLREQLMEHRDTVRLRGWQAQALRDAGDAVRARNVMQAARAMGMPTLGAAHPFMQALDRDDRQPSRLLGANARAATTGEQ